MEHGLTHPAPIEINPIEKNNRASWTAVAELQPNMSDSRVGFRSGIMAVNHNMVKPCETKIL